MTTVTAKSPAELDSEADRLETRAQVLEGEYCAARREAARLRATAAALRAVTAAGDGLTQAQDALDAAQAGYEAAQAGERESTRRCQAAEAEAEKATDALNWAKERQAEPHELVTLEERLSACARVAEHEAGAAAGAEHDARMARRALDHTRNAYRAAQEDLAAAQKVAASPPVIDPLGPVLAVNSFFATAAQSALADPRMRNALAGLAARHGPR